MNVLFVFPVKVECIQCIHKHNFGSKVTCRDHHTRLLSCKLRSCSWVFLFRSFTYDSQLRGPFSRQHTFIQIRENLVSNQY